MIKHLKNSLLLLLLYNNWIVHAQYKSLLHTTNNLLNHQPIGDSKFDSTLDSPLDKAVLNRIYRQLINKVLLKSTADRRSDNIENEKSNRHQHSINKRNDNVHIVHSISAQDYKHNINKRHEDTSRDDFERDIPIGRRRVRKLKANPIERPDTSTDSNRDDAYYVTNIESTNVNKLETNHGGIDRKFETNTGIARKLESSPGENSLEQTGSNENGKVELINAYTAHNRLEEFVDKAENDEYGNKYSEMDLNTNTTDESGKSDGSRDTTGQTSLETQRNKLESEQTVKDVRDIGVNGSHEDSSVKNTEQTNNNSAETTSSETFKKLFPTYPTPSGNFFARKKDLLRNIVLKRCHSRYSFLCLKIDLMKIIDKLNTTDQFTVLPGIQIVRHPNVSGPVEIPTSVILSILRNSTTPSDSLRLDELLLEKLRSYVSQLSVSIKLLDTAHLLSSEESTALMSTESTGRTFFSGSWKDTLSNFMGRGKKQNYGHAALWSAGTLAALAFAALAALSGKALITSILALLLAAICAFKGHHGHGGGYGGNYGYGKTSHYEIITKPAHFHDHEHLHSANLAAAASPYASYARQLVTDPYIPTLGFDPETDAYAPYGPHEE